MSTVINNDIFFCNQILIIGIYKVIDYDTVYLLFTGLRRVIYLL